MGPNSEGAGPRQRSRRKSPATSALPVRRVLEAVAAFASPGDPEDDRTLMLSRFGGGDQPHPLLNRPRNRRLQRRLRAGSDPPDCSPYIQLIIWQCRPRSARRRCRAPSTSTSLASVWPPPARAASNCWKFSLRGRGRSRPSRSRPARASPRPRTTSRSSAAHVWWRLRRPACTSPIDWPIGKWKRSC